MSHHCSNPLELLRNTWLFDHDWYLSTYPDVEKAAVDPADHYLHFGAALRRHPGPYFNTVFYLETYGDTIPEGTNPLVHYLCEGHDKGYERLPPWSPEKEDRLNIQAAQAQLWSLGLTDKPLANLTRIAEGAVPETRALASRELALWHLRQDTAEGYRNALVHVADRKSVV